MRGEIELALGAIGDERATDLLVNAFWDDHWTALLPGRRVMPISVQALEHVRGQKAEEIVRLAHALENVASEDQALRSEAVANLRGLGDLGAKGLRTALRFWDNAGTGDIEPGSEEWMEEIHMLSGITAALKAALEATCGAES